MSIDPNYRAALLGLFGAEDPARLIKMGASDNEYEPEVGAVAAWTEPATPDRVCNLMRRWFGDEWGQMSDADAERLADGILRLQREYSVIPRPQGE